MVVLEHQTFEPKKELSKAWTDDLLMVYEEIAWSLPEAAKAGEGAKMTRERYRELFANVVKETQQGVSLGMNGVVIVGRKNM